MLFLWILVIIIMLIILWMKGLWFNYTLQIALKCPSDRKWCLCNIFFVLVTPSRQVVMIWPLLHKQERALALLKGNRWCTAASCHLMYITFLDVLSCCLSSIFYGPRQGISKTNQTKWLAFLGHKGDNDEPMIAPVPTGKHICIKPWENCHNDDDASKLQIIDLQLQELTIWICDQVKYCTLFHIHMVHSESVCIITPTAPT